LEWFWCTEIIIKKNLNKYYFNIFSIKKLQLTTSAVLEHYSNASACVNGFSSSDRKWITRPRWASFILLICMSPPWSRQRDWVSICDVISLGKENKNPEDSSNPRSVEVWKRGSLFLSLFFDSPILPGWWALLILRSQFSRHNSPRTKGSLSGWVRNWKGLRLSLEMKIHPNLELGIDHQARNPPKAVF